MTEKWIVLVAALGLLAGCDDLVPKAPEPNQLLDGPIEGLTPTQAKLFVEGDEVFGTSFSFSDGVGPVFNAQSCDTCHPGEGKGHPGVAFFRFGRETEDGFDPLFELSGPQLQDQAMPGFVGETIPDEATGVSLFLPPAVTGLGLVESVDDETLIALADPDDADGDGISGRVSMVSPRGGIAASVAVADTGGGKRFQLIGGRYIGRFGLKAAQVTLLHQTAVAFQEDMGLTNDIRPNDPINMQVGSQSADLVADPEIGSGQLSALAFYLHTLQPPQRRGADEASVQRGEQVFAELNCSGCHVPSLTTGKSTIAALSETTFAPYSDFLLHDMGPQLDDGYTEGSAETFEWRTPPLWGLGLVGDAQGGRTFLLHDGRAQSVDEAIRMHGGEAQRARDAYTELGDPQREELLTFLESL